MSLPIHRKPLTLKDVPQRSYKYRVVPRAEVVQIIHENANWYRIHERSPKGEFLTVSERQKIVEAIEALIGGT